MNKFPQVFNVYRDMMTSTAKQGSMFPTDFVNKSYETLSTKV